MITTIIIIAIVLLLGFYLIRDKKPALITPNDIEPINENINTTQAKKIFRQFLKDYNLVDKDLIYQDIEEFTDGINHINDELKENVDMYKDEIKDAKQTIKKLKQDLKKATDKDEIEEIKEEIEDEENEIASHIEDTELYKKQLADFKADKRKYLVDEMNKYLT